MSWSRYFLSDYLTRREFKQVDRQLRSQRRIQMSARRELRERIQDLEDENGRLALMVRALTEACIRKGVFSRDELQQIATEVDLWDGADDDRYGLPPDRDDDEPRSPHEFLGDLERRDRRDI